MASGHAADDPDRLPWIADARRPRRTRESPTMLFWAFLAIVLVAGFSYWLGIKSVGQPDSFTDVLGGSETTERLPDASGERAARTLPPASVQAPGLPDAPLAAEAPPVPIPGVVRARPTPEEALPTNDPARSAARPGAQPEPAPIPPRIVPTTPERPVAAPRQAARPAPARVVARAPVRTARAAPVAQARMQAWPADRSAGARGRVVRVGAFYSRRQAKRGWARIVRVYPGIRRLRAVVVGTPSRRTGQTFYRLQFGTTSQAHSAVLCQRMRVIGQSCVTVGLTPRGA